MNEQACCAHSKVKRVSIDTLRYSHEHWECEDCSTQFFPANHDQRRDRLLDEFAMHSMTGLLANEHCTGRFNELALRAFNSAEAMLAEHDKRAAKK